MSRMIDRMLAHGFDPPARTMPSLLATFPARRKQVLHSLESSELFVVDNVCRYIYEVADQEQWDLRKDFPNLAPPFPSFFMEMRHPHYVSTHIEDGVRVTLPRIDLEGWGVLFESDDLTKTKTDWNSPARLADLRLAAGRSILDFGQALADKAKQFGPQVGSHLNGFEKQAVKVLEEYARAENGEDMTPDLAKVRWFTSASLFLEPRRSQIVGPVMTWHLDIDASGTLAGDSWASTTSASPSSTVDQDAYSEWMNNIVTLIYPALLAISFLHCKNVKVARQVPPAKLSRANQKRHHRPLVRFHTLEITPMKKVLEREGALNSTGLKKALHICRGHFKTFTPERKLFGRHTGTYWWDAHVRGTAEQGISVKDYAVNQPAESATDPEGSNAF